MLMDRGFILICGKALQFHGCIIFVHSVENFTDITCQAENRTR